MTNEELLAVARQSAADLRRTRQDAERLLHKQKTMQQLVQTDDTYLSSLFHNLQDGIRNLSQKLCQPVCMWGDGCNQEFETVSVLYDHCKQHIKNSGGAAPIDRHYICKWKGCKHKPFLKLEALGTNLREHTGREEDSFLILLLAGQPRSLNTAKSSMRWHPAVFKWCLQQQAHSRQGYEEMRTAGFIN